LEEENMRNSWYKKVLTIGIIFLFIGLSMIPNISGYIERNSTCYDVQNKILLDNPPEEQWNITFEGKNSECGFEVQQISDGGYITVGNSFDDYNKTNEVVLCKVDAWGNKIWYKTFKGEGADWSSGYSVKQCLDGGYIVTGDTEGKLWLFKTDTNGNKLWDKTFGSYCDEHGFSVIITTDGGFLIAGDILMDWEGWYDIWLIKTDENGNEEWNQILGAVNNDDMCFAAQQTIDNGFIITGLTAIAPFEDYDVLLIKTDSNGNEIWSRTFGGFDYDGGWDVFQTIDGGYIITGLTESYGAGSGDVWLIKTDENGNEVWNKTFGGIDYDWGLSGHQTADNGFIVTGLTESYDAGDGDLWLIKTDENGNGEWSKTFGGEEFDVGRSIQETSDKGFIITGGTVSFGLEDSDLWLIKIFAYNQPPGAPTITGETNGKVGVEYEYTFSSEDQNEDGVMYHIDWDDGNFDTTGVNPSGVDVKVKHSWNNKGTYTIRAFAEDEHGLIGPEGTLTVTIKKGKNRVINSPFLNFLQSHLNLFPILRLLLQR
jgi:hypothetical protein